MSVNLKLKSVAIFIAPIAFLAFSVFGNTLQAKDLPDSKNDWNLQRLVQSPLVTASYGPSPNGGIRPNGAAGSNTQFDDGKRQFIYIGEQRLVGDYVTEGLIHQDGQLRLRGWKAVEWGLQYQNADGSFMGNDAFHGSTMFLEGALRALSLELEAGVPSEGEQYLSKLILGVRSIASRKITADREILNGDQFSHRFWIKAALMAEAAGLSGEKKFMEQSKFYALRAIEAQLPDGISPEKGGYDVGYQATGVVFAARFYASSDDPDTKKSTAESIDRSLAWLVKHINADGTVDAEGSTRVGIERNYAGKMKNVPYGLIAEAFACGGVILGREDYQQTANLIEQSAAFSSYYAKPVKPKAEAVR